MAIIQPSPRVALAGALARAKRRERRGDAIRVPVAVVVVVVVVVDVSPGTALGCQRPAARRWRNRDTVLCKKLLLPLYAS